MKILVIGDTHLRDSLSYSSYISDGRVSEKRDILDFIVKSAEDCEHVVFMGDFFNSRNNSSETNRSAVELLERLEDKYVCIISGNHEKKRDGKTAIDFLAEIKKDNWHIFTKPGVVSVGGEKKIKFDFLPYMLNSELEVENYEEAAKKVVNELEGGDILFAHHAISGTSFNGISVDTFNEMILPRAELEKKYKLVVAGHIHTPQHEGRTLITGSLFTSEVGEIEKFIFKIDESMTVEKLKVPAREIHKLENPTIQELTKLPKNSIVKIVVTDKNINIDELEVVASGLDAHLIITDYPGERKKMKIEEGAFDFSIEALLKLYAKEKDIDYAKLIKGLELISND